MSSSTNVLLKVPRGTRDTLPPQMMIRQKTLQVLQEIFEKHGAVSIDTPVFELRDILMQKYGEDSKLIFDLADHTSSAEQCSLRYDLTVPFCRYVAHHGLDHLKRYHIGRVYRRDTPALERGRFREFFQADLDIAGVYDPMLPDADVLKAMCEILDALPLGNYQIKISHRKLLDAIMELSGVPNEQLRSICSSIDKLDKESWEIVKTEMIYTKGLPESVADNLAKYILNGHSNTTTLDETKQEDNTFELVLKRLLNNPELNSHPIALEALNDLQLLLDYLRCFQISHRFVLDLSLARGLDYYTGCIYEAVLIRNDVKLGSVAAGGRYDNLIGTFGAKSIPAVGISIGIERILGILEEAELKKQLDKDPVHGCIRSNKTEVLVCTIGKDMCQRRLEICQQLWSAKIATEFIYENAPKPAKQIDYALKAGIPFVIWIGKNEMEFGGVSIKVMNASHQKILDLTSAQTFVHSNHLIETLTKWCHLIKV